MHIKVNLVTKQKNQQLKCFIGKERINGNQVK